MVWLAQDVAVPIASYKKEAECAAVLKLWEFEPGKARGECVLVRIKKK